VQESKRLGQKSEGLAVDWRQRSHRRFESAGDLQQPKYARLHQSAPRLRILVTCRGCSRTVRALEDQTLPASSVPAAALAVIRSQPQARLQPLHEERADCQSLLSWPVPASACHHHLGRWEMRELSPTRCIRPRPRYCTDPSQWQRQDRIKILQFAQGVHWTLFKLFKQAVLYQMSRCKTQTKNPDCPQLRIATRCFRMHPPWPPMCGSTLGTSNDTP
jgi:hypothetical protein